MLRASLAALRMRLVSLLADCMGRTLVVHLDAIAARLSGDLAFAGNPRHMHIFSLVSVHTLVCLQVHAMQINQQYAWHWFV